MSVRRTFDRSKLAAGLAAPGNDPRVWIAEGTVATVGDAPDFSDAEAVVATAAGIDVDVVIHPHDWPLTCRYELSAGQGFIAAPIRPGDLVVVAIPLGDLQNGGRILRVTSSASAPIPVEDDGKPVWRNDRLCIVARDGTPIEIRTMQGGKIRVEADGLIEISNEGGAALRINTDGTLQLGGSAASEQLIAGTSYRQQEVTMNVALAAAFSAMAALCTSPPLSALAPGFTALAAAVNAFEAASLQYLSTVVKTK